MADANSSSVNALLLSLFLLFVATQFMLNVLGSFAESFYVDIIHRDSLESPLRDPSSTPFSRFQAAVNRSTSRQHYLRQARFHDSLSIPVANHNFEFLMIFYIGSKSKKVYASIDTASDVIWVLCNPCSDCYEHIPKIFDPISSESYQKLDCRVAPCTEYRQTKCNNENKCKYHGDYIDGTFVEGILSTETLKFNEVGGKEKFALHNVFFGCTHKTEGSFDEGSIGIVGLNRGKLSLMSQLGPFFGRRFSYCLPSKINHRTQLYFGAAAVVSGPGTMFTPMYYGFQEEQYYLILKAIKVGKEEPIIVSPDPQEGNIIFDSGTPLTFLQPNLLQQFFDKVKKRIRLPSKHHDDYSLCFDTSSRKGRPLVPSITFIFDNDVEFLPSKHGVFEKIDSNTMCCLVSPTKENDGMQIIGNRAQAGYRIGFDAEVHTIAIRKEDC